ncbi:hypothetical protein SASPL_156561 [Salvia splendens]|uniref:Aminoacyl-transfer RNA synthetases class-II family profile domain-containing protein n=1 Tax=Salvia splendens TaxID=180675 RepID=A0A8X8VWG9_SALSN|nr:hypothetical protein SASPL_156561 [Salvia splendens]
MHAYRTHTCAALDASAVGQTVRLSGWVHRRRDHGGVLFIDLRDHYGITQIVADSDSAALPVLESVRVESVVTIDGVVKARAEGTTNANLATGEIEVFAQSVTVQSAAQELPMPVAGDAEYPEDIRLRYRFLDLRRERLHANILLRSHVISSLAPADDRPGLHRVPDADPDRIVARGRARLSGAQPRPSRQIAPCFRDEDARADRSPGEFYQLDFEMSYVTQEDVFQAIEPVLHGVFEEFANWQGKGRTVSPLPFKRIPYRESMLKYGNDKPDPAQPADHRGRQRPVRRLGLRPLRLDRRGGRRGPRHPRAQDRRQSRKFFDDMNAWAQSEGFAGLGYATRKGGEWGGPIAKNHGEDKMSAMADALGLGPDDGLFFAAGKEAQAAKLAGLARTRVADQLGLIDDKRFEFCWIVDFPMFEYDEDAKKVDFSHNPFSMPQGELEALETKDPLDILAYQAFEIAGYSQADVDANFAGMINAFKFGAPPHGGSAPGVDRIVMLLADEPNIREVIVFPMTQKAEDLMMGAPSFVSAKQLRELNLRSTAEVKAEPKKDADQAVAPAAG